MVDSAIPVARATCAMPPYPIACASVAAHTRRDRSVRTGDSAACFARRVARSTSARYYSLIRSTRSYFLTGPKRAQALLLAGQIGASVLLLVATTLLIRTFVRLHNEPLGFDMANLTIASVSL